MKLNVRHLTGMGVMAALSIALLSIARFPIIPTATFLEYDAADIPIMLTTFMYGPIYGLLLTLIVCVIQGLTFSAQSGFYGILMHFIATGSFVLAGGFIYKYNHNIKGALVALAVGTLAAVLIMIPANLILTPIYLQAVAGMPEEAAKGFVRDAIFIGIIPFNLIKFGINSILCFILYKKMHKLMDFLTSKIVKDKNNNLLAEKENIDTRSENGTNNKPLQG